SPTPVTVTVTDDHQGMATQTFNWSVSPAGITGQDVPVTATEGVALTDVTVARFTDANPNSLVTDLTQAQIDWGDGTAVSVGAIYGPDGSFTVTGSHTYLHPGVFPVHVTLTDTAGTTGKVSETATVAAAPVTAVGLPQTVVGTPAGLQVAAFWDLNRDE